jgi:DNA-binding IclR family transcriptional regulator
VITIAEPLDLDVLRIRHEFLSMPDLRASVDQMAARIGVHTRHAHQMLEALVDEGFLTHTADNQYVRATGATS